MIRTLIASALTALILTACAPASYDLPPNDRATLQTRIDGFQNAVISNDIETVVAAVPPKVIGNISKRSGVPVAELRRGLVDLGRKTTKSTKIQSFDLALDRATFAQTPNGRAYALIPTQTIFTKASGTKRQMNSTTLAFEDEKIWYLVRVEDKAQLDLLKLAYPEFADLRFPKATLSILK